MPSHRRPTLLATCVLVALAGSAAASGPIGPEEVPAAVADYAESRGRSADQARHPEYRAGTAPFEAAAVAAGGNDGGRALNVDPYREGWDRGVTLPFPLRTRYGADLDGTLYAPPASRSGRLPAVVYVAGGGTGDHAPQAVAQSLAEAGYVVWTITAHDSAGNDATPPDPDPATPDNEWCVPGAWQQPQELGIRETGPCAGQLPGGASDPVDLARMVTAAYAGDMSGFFPVFAEFYERARAARVFPALDAADQLLSAANPLRSRVDGKRLGLIGWSLGAHAALVVGNADPRFSAVVSHDGFGRLRPTTGPRVPTLFLHHDVRNDTVRLNDVDHSRLPGAQDARLFVEAGVPTGVVVPRASRHASFVQLNYLVEYANDARFGYPDAALGAVDTPRDSERVIVHYTRAWLDRFLGARTGPQRKAAEAALVGRVFSTSTDASSIGQGSWDPVAGNLPYTIGGERTADHLSSLGPSWVSLPGQTCADLRTGC